MATSAYAGYHFHPFTNAIRGPASYVMKRYLLPLLPALAVIFLSCSSGKTAYKRGDYAEAVQKASRRLSQKSGLSRRGHELAGMVIQRAFVEGYEQHQATIRKLANPPSQPFRWEAIFAEYDILQKMATDARQAAGDADWLATYPGDYTQRLNDTRQLAAEERYALAESAFAHREEDRMMAREAYEQYQKAISWVPNYRQSTQQSLEAFSYAVLRVVLEPPLPTRELSPAENAELGRYIVSHLQGTNKPSPYVHLYDPNQVEVSIDGQVRLYDGLPIDEAVQVAVSHYEPYNDNIISATRNVESNKLYKVGTKRINDSTVVDVMEKVKGTITLYTHTVEARMAVDLRAIDTKTNRVVWTDSDRSSCDWKTQWETFSGDNRALNGHTLLTATGTPPTRWHLLDGLSSNMGGSIVGTIRQHYKKR